MALTITNSRPNQPRTSVMGDRRAFVGQITFDSSYPTGGEVLTAAEVGLTRITHVDVAAKGGTETVVWDHVNSKLQIFTADGVEALNATNASTIVAHVQVFGY